MINKMKERSLVFIDKISKDDFIQDMVNGTLSEKAICHYLKADAIYLEKFADVYALLFAKISDKASKNFFLGQIDFIFNHDIGAHHILAKVAGKDYHDIIADKAWYPSSDHYIKHMYYQLNQDNPAYILQPCFRVHRSISKWLKKFWKVERYQMRILLKLGLNSMLKTKQLLVYQLILNY